MDRDTQANQILKRIGELAKGYKGKLLLTVRDAGNSGTGYICLPNTVEIIFDFVFASSGFNIVVRGLEQTLSRPNDYIDYSNEAEIESIIKMIEKRIKILDNSQ